MYKVGIDGIREMMSQVDSVLCQGDDVITVDDLVDAFGEDAVFKMEMDALCGEVLFATFYGKTPHSKRYNIEVARLVKRFVWNHMKEIA